MTIDRLLRLGLALAFNPARLVEDAASAARRLAVLLACVIFAGFLLLPALGCAAAGVWILVQHHLGPVWAAFITAAAFALVAVIALLIGVVASRDPARERGDRRAAGEARGAAPAGAAALDMAAAALPALLGLLTVPRKAAAAGAAAGRGFFSRHKGALLLAAAVAGLVMGQDLIRPRRRDPKSPPK